MKMNTHAQTQQWLLTKSLPPQSNLGELQAHLAACQDCQRLANQVTRLEERLALESSTPSFSPSFLKQKSTQVRNKTERRRMKTIGMNVLRFSGWTTLAVVLLAVGWVVRTWIVTPGNPMQPASIHAQVDETTPTVPAPGESPMVLDPALCTGPSITDHLPAGEIAFDGGQVEIGKIIFEFWLSCSNSTQSYVPGTQPIERLGLHALWTYQNLLEEVISDYYGFEPNIYHTMDKSPASNAGVTGSGASGVLSVAQPGSAAQGMFVLPHLENPLRFIAHVETSEGTYAAAISFHLEAGADGYRPVNVHVEALPFIANEPPLKEHKFSYPDDPRFDGPGICPVELISVIKVGTGELGLPLKDRLADQDFPGVILYSRDTSEPVLAADAGSVIYAGEDATNGRYLVMIDHGNGYQTIYSYLFSVDVKCGDVVEKGQTIGTIQATQAESQAYLVFEVYFQGVPVNLIGR